MSERPLECAQCKKQIHVLYQEIVGSSVTRTEMCADCPVLDERLHGTSPSPDANQGIELFCNRCHTSFHDVKMGGPLGCTECYLIFGDMLISELSQAKRIPIRLQKECLLKKSLPLHVGIQPTEIPFSHVSSQMHSLQEALQQALKKENYEQAAQLRDQIKGLMEEKS